MIYSNSAGIMKVEGCKLDYKSVIHNLKLKKSSTIDAIQEA